MKIVCSFLSLQPICEWFLSLSLTCSLMASDSTRSKTAIWLIGQPEPKLPERILPIKEPHHNETNSVSQGLKLTIDELLQYGPKPK